MVFALCATASTAQELPVLGRIVGLSSADLSASRTGQIIELHAKVGDQVQHNDKLVSIDCAIDEARLAATQAAVEAQKLTYESKKQLLEYSSATALEVDVAYAEWQRSEADSVVRQSILEKCAVNAPFNGVVTKWFVDPFEYVQEGDPVLRLIDISELQIEFRAPVDWLSHVQVNDALNIKLDALSLSTMANVSQIDPEVDAIDQTVRIKATIQQLTDKIPLGAAGRVIPPKGLVQ